MRAETDNWRRVRSFVLRGGRLTDGQKRALNELWPRYGIEPSTEALNFQTIYSNQNPVILDIGFGDGQSTWQMALANAEQNFLGLEVHPPGVGHLMLKLEQSDLKNVRIACVDAVEFIHQRVPDDSLQGVRLYFPDPWPKKRHHKRRIVQAEFITLVARKLKPGGVLHLATDWEPYAQHMLAVVNNGMEFENCAETGDFCARPQWRALTKYEARGQRLGHSVLDLIFRKKT